MKALTLEETRLKEEMKERCLTKGQYKDEKAKDKFKMLCHLEDFEVQYWELQKENERLKDNLNKLNKKYENAVADYEKTMFEKEQLKKQLEEYKATNKILSHELTKDKVLQQDCLTTCCGIPIGDIPKLITQQKEFIKYLEDLIKFYKNRDSYMVVDIHGSYDLNNIELELLEEILQKYKEIIGDDK